MFFFIRTLLHIALCWRHICLSPCHITLAQWETTVETVPVKLQDLVVADGTRIAEVVDASLRCVFGVQHLQNPAGAVTLAPIDEVKGHYQTFCDEIDVASQDKELIQILQSK